MVRAMALPGRPRGGSTGAAARAGLDGSAPTPHTTQVRTGNGQRFTIDFYTVDEDVIWGATGRMLNQFLRAWEAAAEG